MGRNYAIKSTTTTAKYFIIFDAMKILKNFKETHKKFYAYQFFTLTLAIKFRVTFILVNDSVGH